MQQTGDFFNDGFGWKCRQCDAELRLAKADDNSLPRYFREGEAEATLAELENAGRAKWTDATRRFLTCPRCGITEPFELS